MKLYRYLPFLVLLPAVSCGPVQRVAATLDDVETYINDRPDSALAVLRALGPDSLCGPGQRARAALLHQMALDKCYIDITSDSILAPAFWYLKHGTADQRLKTWYYRSVLARNTEDIDTEMACLVRGEQYIPRAKDPLMAGRLYTAKRVIFLHIYDVDDAVRSAEQAVEAFRLAGDRRRQDNAVISLANLYNLQERYVESSRLLDTLESRWEVLTSRQQKLFTRVRFNQLVETGPATRIDSFVEQYLLETPASEVDWVLVAQAHLAMGDVSSAESFLSLAGTESLDADETFTYLKVRADVLHALGREEEAMEASREYRNQLDSLVERSLSTRARFLAEELRLRRSRASRGWWMGGLLLMTLLLFGWGWYASRDRDKHRQNVSSLQGELSLVSGRLAGLKKRVRKAEREADTLRLLLEQERLPDDVSQLISERVALLNQYTLAQISESDGHQALDDLAKALSRERREQILEDLTLQFGYLHPEFSRFLGQHWLSGQEKHFCTLLALGRDTKEIARLTGLSVQRCYNIFNVIRRKVGLPPRAGSLSGLLREKIGE